MLTMSGSLWTNHIHYCSTSQPGKVRQPHKIWLWFRVIFTVAHKSLQSHIKLTHGSIGLDLVWWWIHAASSSTQTTSTSQWCGLASYSSKKVRPSIGKLRVLILFQCIEPWARSFTIVMCTSYLSWLDITCLFIQTGTLSHACLKMTTWGPQDDMMTTRWPHEDHKMTWSPHDDHKMTWGL